MLACSIFAVAHVQARPTRIVSLNVCTDGMLLELAERADIASITYLSLDPEVSNLVDRARGLHINHGLAEEVIPLRPDLVLSGRYTAKATTSLLRKLGYKVLVFDPTTSFQGLRDDLGRLATAIGREGRGKQLIAEIDRRIAASTPPQAGPRPTAVVFHANGLTEGQNSLVNDVIVAAGFDNLSARLSVDGSGYLALERLLLADPALIIVGDFRPERPALAHQALRHRALKAFLTERSAVSIPERLWSCGTSFVAEAVERLAKLRAGLTPKAAGTGMVRD